ncbi:hypothetical protein V6N13_092553 [Hibiscus sabdariffa]
MENPTNVLAATEGLSPTGAPGDRPPDAVLVMDEFPALERSGSPLVEEKQRVSKKWLKVVNPSREDETEMSFSSIGTDICMGAVGGDGSHQVMQGLVAKVLDGPSASFVPGAVVGGDVSVAIAKASFRDTLMGDNSSEILTRQLSDMDVKVTKADARMRGDGVLHEIMYPEAVGGSRKPENLYDRRMQVVNQKRRPVASKNEKSGLQTDQLMSQKSSSRFESLSDALPESDVTDPVLPEIVVSEPVLQQSAQQDDKGDVSAETTGPA